MAFRSLSQRFYHISRINSSIPTIYKSQSIFASPFSPAILTHILAQNPANIIFRREFHNVPDSEEKGFFRRFLHKPSLSQSSQSDSSSSMLIGEKMMKKLKLLNFSKDRLRLDGLIPPAQPEEISVEDAKKLLRVSQLEMLKTSLKQIPRSCISYPEFLEICVKSSSPDQGFVLAKLLDDSGSVIVLGNIVFLRPEQVTKALEGVIPLSTPNLNDPLRKELAEMEKAKEEIDRQAVRLVRMELWGGLGYLVVQTVGFMRLTFWELSWDVMEPICFYVTSFYVMAGYSFFMKTSQEPTFEGFFNSRFKTKQRKLMKKKNFDVERFNELRRACYPFASEPPLAGGHPVTASEKGLVSARL